MSKIPMEQHICFKLQYTVESLTWSNSLIYCAIPHNLNKTEQISHENHNMLIHWHENMHEAYRWPYNWQRYKENSKLDCSVACKCIPRSPYSKSVNRGQRKALNIYIVIDASRTPEHFNMKFTPKFCCPHSVVTRIGSVTRDQKNPVWVGCCGVDIYHWCLTGLTKAWWCV